VGYDDAEYQLKRNGPRAGEVTGGVGDDDRKSP